MSSGEEVKLDTPIEETQVAEETVDDTTQEQTVEEVADDEVAQTTADQLLETEEETMEINLESDEDVLKDLDQTWEDLISLKDGLGVGVVNLTTQVGSLITQIEIRKQLSHQDLEKLDRLAKVFLSDITEFSEKVKSLREQHEERTGPITSIEDFDTYNRIAIQYDVLYTELDTLLTPTIAEMVLLTHVAVAVKTKNTTDVSQEEPKTE